MFRTRINTVTGLALAACLLAGLLVAPGCDADGTGIRPTLLVKLPDTANTPDGMTLDEKTGDIYLCCPNLKDQKYPAVIMKIDKDNKVTKFYDFPKSALHPGSGKIGTMGLDIGPDGNLYIADNQYFWDKNYASRLIRVNIKDGKAVGTDILVEGTKLSNAIIWRGNNIYISDTFFDVPNKPGISGIWRFSLEELNTGKPVKLDPKAFDPHSIGTTDPHLIATFQTFPWEHRGDTAGADGLTFDQDGNLYCGNFGDGVISKISFDTKGNVVSNKILIKDKTMPSADGMYYDAKRNLIYIADSERNAIRAFTPEGKLSTVWENGANTTGADGLLDQPCEVLVRGDTLYIACFDLSFPGLLNQENDKDHTISVIKLPAK
jgi:sugar lactone lactonase YvrE